jgi:hypothetical protein
MYANITLKTVTLYTLNNVAVCVTDASAKHAPMICPLSKWASLPFSNSFTWTVTQHKHTACKQMEEFSALPTEILSV